jgi:hypothetical protein
MLALLQTWEQTADGRAIFLDCYLRMTRNVEGAIESGEFHDGEWVAGFLRHFADYYFDAVAAYARQDPATPAIWRRTLDAARQPDTAPVQNRLLGVNAHINYDLVLTLVDALEPEWPTLSPALREHRHSDHDHINKIIGRTVDSVQDQVLERYTPWMELVDWAFGPLDEWLASQVIARWRTRDWAFAMRWLETPEAEGREALRLRLEEHTLRLADAILLGRE